jgi:C4-dicarboxylate transporter DctM subunit
MATIAIMLVLIILGLFIDPSVLIVMFGATVSSAGILLGFDPIHFGIVMVIAMMMGAVTPPVGSMLYISCSIARIPIEKSIRVLLPFISVLFFVAFAVLFVPGMVTWINVLVFR